VTKSVELRRNMRPALRRPHDYLLLSFFIDLEASLAALWVAYRAAILTASQLVSADQPLSTNSVTLTRLFR